MLDDDDTEAMDESALKKMILQFEKRFSKNQEMRIKYSDTPEKLVFFRDATTSYILQCATHILFVFLNQIAVY